MGTPFGRVQRVKTSKGKDLKLLANTGTGTLDRTNTRSKKGTVTIENLEDRGLIRFP